ncbi:neutral/alkaline non-lysosomal ceramidase N-terminal domain-containing protein [Desmonostoc muscorum LEGE 12446]|uniref:neutral/alkaline non-lysosomal ceramidase N-terminal domain-containing protein n=1 Tax=Desmonostoc muscorum TaxID=1179 RepID=UPI001F29B148|nr:neutral/alkaline non-lysosomal ceramidase N-terminal domain-containing protein [Desmonostoc muscorum]MCF2151396.1 neutral/alkaline non-lysosomal ceramidase N-terminal domain-containing protein [Desmonostoc muscorum LEGE 12446]
MVYNIGTGISEVTDPAIGKNMQGMADPSQKIRGVESKLYARTFVITDATDKDLKKPVVIVIADIWASVEAVKTAVIKRLKSQPKFQSLNEENVLISGTHTHSGPGGFSHSALYEYATGGFDTHTFECVVSGIVKSIQKAFNNLAPGKIYINKGIIADCGRQRSKEAYLNNPAEERKRYNSDTDKEMLLLKFVRVNQTKEVPIGVLNWYAIHPTDRGQKTTVINGDNKGYASYLFEKALGTNYSNKETFIAAFANSNCGDVSGNVEFGYIPDGSDDKAHMELHGRKQFDMAKKLFDSATEELQGEIGFRHTRVDMSNIKIENQPGKRTWPGALGLAFAAGSTEDSIPKIELPVIGTIDSFELREGLIEAKDQISVTERAAQLAIISAMAATFGVTEDKRDFVQGHLPKPIILRTGLLNPPITPNILPLQLIKIGSLILTAIPGEITTMAGRRLKETVLNELKDFGIKHLAMAAYANDYSLYITTKEEYDKQHYEGGCTLFGPYTLMAYQQEFRKLANALKNKKAVNPGPSPSKRTASVAKRITIRNLSSSSITVEFFKQSDTVVGGVFDFAAVPLPNGTLQIPKQSDCVYILPSDVNMVKMRINQNKTRIVEKIGLYRLVTIKPDGTATVSNYVPPHV